MTRKQLEGICRFVLTFESDMPIEEVNKQFGLELSDADSHVKALTSYLEKNEIELDDEPKKSENPCLNVASGQEEDNSERNCKNCSYSKINEVIKSGKYRNFICGCTIFKHYTFLDYWKKTAAIHCDKFKEKEVNS